MSKRKLEFYSHLRCEKQQKIEEKSGQTVEELLASCYVKEIVDQIETRSYEQCNSCRCSFEDLMDCYFTSVVIALENDASGVLGKFEEIVKDSVDGYYNTDDVENARRMLTCKIHRRMMAQKNYKYFNDTIRSYKV